MSWLGFGAPAWVAGFAALTVPVAIHLLSRGRQRRVSVGSVRWLAPTQTLRARRVRLRGWWLLALRCLLLAAVALALAEPRLEVAAGAEPTDWLLVAPEVATSRARLEPDNQEAYEALDDALRARAELHWLAPGLPRGDLEAAPPQGDGGLWSLLLEADHLAPAGAAFIVLTPVRSVALGGERAGLERPVDWHDVRDGAKNRWLERAVVVADDRLAVVVGASDANGTRFERLTLDAAVARSSGSKDDLELTAADSENWRLALDGGGSVTTDDALNVPRTTQSLRVAVLYSPERAQDVHYVRAGLEAATEASSWPMTLREHQVDEGASALGEEPDNLIFWLSAAPVPPRVVDRLAAGGVLVSDALERFERCASLLWLPSSAAALRVDRCGTVDGGMSGGGAAAVWSAADGRPLLVGGRVNAGTWLRFASRWNPDWTELVLSSQFPAWLLGLAEQAVLEVPSARRAASDRRSAGAQAVPRQLGAPASGPAGRELPLSSGLWLLVFALAGGERWLALRSVA